MRFKKGKLFWHKEKVCCLPYDDKNAEYHDFLRRAKENGYEELLLTNEMMLEIISYACLEKQQKVYNIEFNEEDAELEAETRELLRKINDTSGNTSLLIENLKNLIISSVTIKRIYIMGNSGNGIEDCFIQNNGIIGIDEAHYPAAAEELCRFIISLTESVCLSVFHD